MSLVGLLAAAMHDLGRALETPENTVTCPIATSLTTVQSTVLALSLTCQLS